MATVYLATHPGLRQRVAVKILHAHVAEDPDLLVRFEHEAQAVAALRHPNIVRVIDFDCIDDRYFMVMEYVEGSTLAARLGEIAGEKRRMPLAEVLRIFEQLCSAIDYAHGEGMVHRDVKPANVLLTARGEPVLTDYGIARILGAHQHTATGTVMGSAHYMSPEQAQGLAVDVRSDLYALGVMLFEALAGKVPYDADSLPAILYLQVAAPVPNVCEMNPTLPPSTATLLRVALAKDPAERFQTGEDLAAALRAELEPVATQGSPAPGTAHSPSAPPQRQRGAEDAAARARQPADELPLLSAEPSTGPTRVEERPPLSPSSPGGVTPARSAGGQAPAVAPPQPTRVEGPSSGPSSAAVITSGLAAAPEMPAGKTQPSLPASQSASVDRTRPSLITPPPSRVPETPAGSGGDRSAPRSRGPRRSLWVASVVALVVVVLVVVIWATQHGGFASTGDDAASSGVALGGASASAAADPVAGGAWRADDRMYDAGINDVAFLDDRNGWAVGFYGVLVTRNGGASWQKQRLGNTRISLSGVMFVDVAHGWAVGDVVVEPNSVPLGSALSSRGIIVATGDGGATWREQLLGSAATFTDVAFPDTSHGWVLAEDGTILATSDGGTTWRSQRPKGASAVEGMAFPDASHGWVVGRSGKVLATSDGGATWNAQNSGSRAWLYAAAFPDASHGWVVGASGTILATSDGGASWRAQRSGSGSMLTGVAFPDAAHGWVVGRGGTILATSDGGATWNAQTSGSTSDVTSISCPDANHGWALDYHSIILAYRVRGE